MKSLLRVFGRFSEPMKEGTQQTNKRERSERVFNYGNVLTCINTLGLYATSTFPFSKEFWLNQGAE